MLSSLEFWGFFSPLLFVVFQPLMASQTNLPSFCASVMFPYLCESFQTISLGLSWEYEKLQFISTEFQEFCQGRLWPYIMWSHLPYCSATFPFSSCSIQEKSQLTWQNRFVMSVGEIWNIWLMFPPCTCWGTRTLLPPIKGCSKKPQTQAYVTKLWSKPKK